MDPLSEAKAYMAERRWADAVGLLNTQLYRHPNDPWISLLLGTCHYELRNPEKAMGCFKLAAQNLPDHPLPLCSQGDVLMMIGETAQAGILYRRALAKFPENELARQSVAWWQAESAEREKLKNEEPK